jgi:AcrR family transcriptional regulator
MTIAVDETLREATVAVLAEHGWSGVTLERVAEKVGRSRVTLWRQGLTVELLLNSLLDALAEDYRDTLWPVLAGTARGWSRRWRPCST